ncbi:MAG: asparagine synthase (glutamine-hydrolyzing) [Candidatus Omnitrophica bacterium]|nr:asparagine synthase (glutamine-hydrolyzing) [Candidatus Omnitrophota bacterium]MBU1924631.1 asparagine synthase (glutamine-hydrolyzing) [Candidatus Omnitrophota bacterium]
MCGICGKFYLNPDRHVGHGLLHEMSRRLYRRGPDDGGIVCKDNMGLGVRRLSIMDKENGRQPVFNEDRSICCAYNGEIYNYTELKDYLIKKKHQFFSKSDSEIIVHMYEEFGLEFIDKLDGMFAIAVFDFNKKKLILVRDRLGIKPVYYSRHDDFVVFASNLKALLTDTDVPRDLDVRGINCYFSYNYFPAEYTPLKKVKKLLPGHYLLCDSNGVQLKQYWQLRYKPMKRASTDSYADEFRGLFKESIERQSNINAPVGSFLSGGIDSSSVACYAQKERGDLKTFTIRFLNDESFDEGFYADIVSRHIKSEHHEISLPGDPAGILDKIGPAMDMPTGEYSIIPIFILSQYAQNHTRVILCGDGADEFLGGYLTYAADILANSFNKIPKRLKRVLFSAVNSFPVQYSWMNFRYKTELFLKGISNLDHVPHYSWREIFSDDEKKYIFQAECFRELQKNLYLKEPYSIFETHFNGSSSNKLLEKALFFDEKIWLPDGVLGKADMASMFNSLETRFPFLSNKLVDFACRLPLSKKINGFNGKYILKKAFKNDLPRKVISRGKQGLSVPIAKWFRYDLKKFASEKFLTAAGEIDNVINRKYPLMLLDRHARGQGDFSRKLWNMLMFFIWFDSFCSFKKNDAKQVLSSDLYQR